MAPQMGGTTLTSPSRPQCQKNHKVCGEQSATALIMSCRALSRLPSMYFNGSFDGGNVCVCHIDNSKLYSGRRSPKAAVKNFWTSKRATRATRTRSRCRSAQARGGIWRAREEGTWSRGHNSANSAKSKVCTIERKRKSISHYLI